MLQPREMSIPLLPMNHLDQNGLELREYVLFINDLLSVMNHFREMFFGPNQHNNLAEKVKTIAFIKAFAEVLYQHMGVRQEQALCFANIDNIELPYLVPVGHPNYLLDTSEYGSAVVIELAHSPCVRILNQFENLTSQIKNYTITNVLQSKLIARCRVESLGFLAILNGNLFKDRIVPLLDAKSVLALNACSKELRNEMHREILSMLMVRSNVEAVMPLLGNDPNLLNENLKMTDLSGETWFMPIYMYAKYMADSRMCTAIRTHFKMSKKLLDEQEKVLATLGMQFKNEHPSGFERLMNYCCVLQVFMARYDYKPVEVRLAEWSRVIDAAQKLPAWSIRWISRKTPVYGKEKGLLNGWYSRENQIKEAGKSRWQQLDTTCVCGRCGVCKETIVPGLDSWWKYLVKEQGSFRKLLDESKRDEESSTCTIF